MYIKVCRGCGNTFETTRPNRLLCVKDCGRSQSGRRTIRDAEGRREFIGVDGEGVTDSDGSHTYVTLAVGSSTLHRHGERLTLHDIFPFLWEQFEEHPNAIFAGYFLSYDFAQWFKGLPRERAEMLFSAKGRALRSSSSLSRRIPFPVGYAGYQFDMLGMRRFKLRPEGDTRWMYINDVGPFWQTSFLKAIDPGRWPIPIVTQKEYDILVDGKASRSTATFGSAMMKYNTLENDVLARAMSELEMGYAANGLVLKRSNFYGPGQGAQLWLNHAKAPTSADIQTVTPLPVLQAGREAFYGGWFEIVRHGHVGTMYEYDINSAYPDAIRNLPCLMHGKWIHNHNVVSPWELRCVTVVAPIENLLCPLPHRNSHGIIARPRTVTGWYWGFELDAAIRAGMVNDIVTHERWVYDPCKCPPPLRAVADMYDRRVSVGKDSAQGKALKNCINSLYGKMAQSVGYPKYSNPIYGSLITAHCRARILDAIGTHPRGVSDVLMVATDGLYFRTAHPALSLGQGLGEWDGSVKHGATLFMPGVYWDDKTRTNLGQNVAIKSRGVNARDLADNVSRIDEAFTSFNGCDWPEVTVPVGFSVISPVLALARNKWWQCGDIRTFEHHGTTKTLSSNPRNKRHGNALLVDDLWTTVPHGDLGVNYGYTRSLGMTLEALRDNDVLLNDSGTFNQDLSEMLHYD